MDSVDADLPTNDARPLEVRGLTKRFDKRAAVDGLDLTIRPGELYALLGPNGAGKTTTMRMVAGLLEPTGGAISVFGIDALAEPQRHDVEGLPCGEHGAVAGAGVVGVGMGDERARNRADRVDEEIAGRAVETLGTGNEQVRSAHGSSSRAGRPRWPDGSAGACGPRREGRPHGDTS